MSQRFEWVCESLLPPGLPKDLTFYLNDNLTSFRIQMLVIVLRVWREKPLKKALTWWAVQRFSHLKVNTQSIDGAVCLACCNQVHSHVALMSVFFPSMEKIESTDATESTGEEFPVNGTPVVETPSVVTGTPFDFAPLWKLIPLYPSSCVPTPPYITAVLRSALLYCPEWGFIQRPANQMSAHPGVSSLCF